MAFWEGGGSVFTGVVLKLSVGVYCADVERLSHGGMDVHGVCVCCWRGVVVGGKLPGC